MQVEAGTWHVARGRKAFCLHTALATCLLLPPWPCPTWRWFNEMISWPKQILALVWAKQSLRESFERLGACSYVCSGSNKKWQPPTLLTIPLPTPQCQLAPKVALLSIAVAGDKSIQVQNLPPNSLVGGEGRDKGSCIEGEAFPKWNASSLNWWQVWGCKQRLQLLLLLLLPALLLMWHQATHLLALYAASSASSLTLSLSPSHFHFHSNVFTFAASPSLSLLHSPPLSPSLFLSLPSSLWWHVNKASWCKMSLVPIEPSLSLVDAGAGSTNCVPRFLIPHFPLLPCFPQHLVANWFIPRKTKSKTTSHFLCFSCPSKCLNRATAVSMRCVCVLEVCVSLPRIFINYKASYWYLKKIRQR